MSRWVCLKKSFVLTNDADSTHKFDIVEESLSIGRDFVILHNYFERHI